MTGKQIQKICRNLINVYDEYGAVYSRHDDDAICEALYHVICGNLPDQFDQNNDEHISQLINLATIKIREIDTAVKQLKNTVIEYNALRTSIESATREIISECWFKAYGRYVNKDKDIDVDHVVVPRIHLTEKQIELCKYVHIEKTYDNILWDENPECEDQEKINDHCDDGNEHVGRCDD